MNYEAVQKYLYKVIIVFHPLSLKMRTVTPENQWILGIPEVDNLFINKISNF